MANAGERTVLLVMEADVAVERGVSAPGRLVTVAEPRFELSAAGI